MFKILIDTCVWLDLAKDYQGQSVLGVLEELVRQKQVSIILPRTVLDEFSRNKARVAEEGGRSLSTVLKRAKEVVHRLGDAQKSKWSEVVARVVAKQTVAGGWLFQNGGASISSPTPTRRAEPCTELDPAFHCLLGACTEQWALQCAYKEIKSAKDRRPSKRTLRSP